MSTNPAFAVTLARRYVRAERQGDISTAQDIRHKADRKLDDVGIEKFYDIINSPEQVPEAKRFNRRQRSNPSDASKGIKFVLGILKRGGKRVSEVQSVLFDKAHWAVADAKRWLKQQGFKVPTVDDAANFFRFRQKPPSRYKEMRTIEAGARQNPDGALSVQFSPDRKHTERIAQMFQDARTGETVSQIEIDRSFTKWFRLPGYVSPANLLHKLRPQLNAVYAEIKKHPNPESIPSSLTGHLALTSDPFFQEQPPEIQAAMMTGMDLAESVKRNPHSSTTIYKHAQGAGFADAKFDALNLGRYRSGEELRARGKDAYSLSGHSHSENAWLRGYKKGYREQAMKVPIPSPSELRKRGYRVSNPEDPESEAAALSEQFHGRPAEKVTTVIEEIEERTDFTELGDLVELKVATLSGYDVTLQFPESGKKVVKLCSSPDGKQLYFLRGDQSIPLDQIHMGADKWKRDRMILGVLYELTYRTAKGFDKFKVCDYFHKLGEETKEKPMLEYDTLNDNLSVSGGQYHITARGIEN